MGLVSIAGTRQALGQNERSMHKAKCVKSLALASLDFIPPIYTPGLSSMNDRYILGASHFWIYFVVSLPMMPVVLLGYYVLVKDMRGRLNGPLRPLKVL